MKIAHLLIATTLIAANLAIPGAQLCAKELPTDVSQKAKPATIRVLLSKQRNNAYIETKGSYSIYNPMTGLLLSASSVGKKDFMDSVPEGLRWGDLLPGISRIRIVPNDARSTILVNGIEYRGCIEVSAQHDKVNVVNEVDIERFLKSTLSCEFPSELNSEVMEALAIIARTNAYYLISQQPRAMWQVEAQDSGYQGHAITLQNLQVDQAINNTRHIVMTYNNEPFAATWNKNSAGKTADFATIFRKDVKAPEGVAAPLAAHEREKHSWFFEMSRQELGRIAGAQMMSGIDLYQDRESEKVYALRIKNGNDARTLDFFTLQNAVGADVLKSNDFQVEMKGDKVVFKGYGEGHGVGLCLLSATSLAEKKMRAHQILDQFFPHTQLVHMRALKDKRDKIADEVVEEATSTVLR